MLYNKLITLFKCTFKISAFTFGGGYVIVPLLVDTFVKKLKWFTDEEILDIAGVAQSSPGAIAINTSVMIGYKSAGIRGALVGATGMILPPFIIMTFVLIVYSKIEGNLYIENALKGMRGGISAIILMIAVKMAYNTFVSKKKVEIFFLMFAVFLLYYFKLSTFKLLIVSFLFGITYHIFFSYFRIKKMKL